MRPHHRTAGSTRVRRGGPRLHRDTAPAAPSRLPAARARLNPAASPGRLRRRGRAPRPASLARRAAKTAWRSGVMLRPASTGLRFRAACPGDAHAIAGLHAESWQRHYRGAYSDAFLDNDATGYLRPLWTERLAIPNPQARTILAEHDGAVVGLVHTILGEDAT